jgi:hypothetical protein
MVCVELAVPFLFRASGFRYERGDFMTAKKRQPADSPVEEFDEGAEPAAEAGEVIEFDPKAQSGTPELEIQAADASAGTVLPEAGLRQARDELKAILGGFEAVAAAAGKAISPGGLGLENIQAVGVGLKSTAGNYTGDLAVKVYVTEKAPLGKLASAATIPDEVNGYPTDVEAIGEITAFTYKARYPRPVPCGVSCGHLKITAGTIGCLMVLDNNRLCLLSNNHVLANQNNAQQGNPIVQPGRYDNGQMPHDLIGVLERFVQINFPGPNLVDAAAAWTSFRLVKPQHVTYRMNPLPLAPSLLLPVMKNGRTTQATLGVITGLWVDNVRVGYGSGVAVFNDQLVIQGIGGKTFSAGGDSGSVIVSARTHQPVGLLFAGSSTHTIANPIGLVMRQLGIRRFIGG